MVTSFAVESRGGRERVGTEVMEALHQTVKRGGEVTVGGEDPVAAEPPVDRHPEPVPEPELQGPGLVLPEISALNPRRRHRHNRNCESKVLEREREEREATR